ncbi:uncharacterized protein STEHIDRAFT_148688 [Stereum hirsutum FP-91666 SS1]|uniref:uncharacterized protein n=1 Tax=Stereum hirsutum (strain FP-91666) TaxID=721885 RepID=UPI0004449866|nr:uncharacterized protein STEHIDRAFT_148688 [Stereum hirsutum FP-91666 SS1]EIM83950.1 hypothetical protein STEHIDRAFT_148688 [Stereum hirsutum FP-91666 SS1]
MYWVAGYKLEHDDVAAFLEKKGLVFDDEKIDDTLAHQRFSDWAIGQWPERVKRGYMPWPQWAEIPGENGLSVRVTGLQTRVVARDPVTKKACYVESDFDRSARDNFLAITDGCFHQSRMEFFCCLGSEVRFPIHEEVPRA